MLNSVLSTSYRSCHLIFKKYSWKLKYSRVKCIRFSGYPDTPPWWSHGPSSGDGAADKQPSALAILACLGCSGSSSIKRNFSMRKSFHLSLEWVWKAPTPEHPTWSFHLFSVYCHFCPPSRQVLGQKHYQINYLHTNSSQKIPHGTLRNLFRVQEQSWGFKPNYDSSPTPCCSTVLSATAADSQVPT